MSKPLSDAGLRYLRTLREEATRNEKREVTCRCAYDKQRQHFLYEVLRTHSPHLWEELRLMDKEVYMSYL